MKRTIIALSLMLAAVANAASMRSLTKTFAGMSVLSSCLERCRPTGGLLSANTRYAAPGLCLVSLLSSQLPNTSFGGLSITQKPNLGPSFIVGMMSFHGASGKDPDSDDEHAHAVSRFDEEGPPGQTVAAEVPNNDAGEADIDSSSGGYNTAGSSNAMNHKSTDSEIGSEEFNEAKQLLKSYPFELIFSQLCKAGPDTGPDLGGGLTLDPDMMDVDKRVLLDWKVQLKGNGLLMLLLSLTSFERELCPKILHDGVNVESVKQFFNADLPEGLHADPSQVAAIMSVRGMLIDHGYPMFALLFGFRSMDDEEGAIDYGGCMTLVSNLSEKDKELALDLKAYLKGNDQDLRRPDIVQTNPEIERLKQFIHADLLDENEDDIAKRLSRVRQFFKWGRRVIKVPARAGHDCMKEDSHHS